MTSARKTLTRPLLSNEGFVNIAKLMRASSKHVNVKAAQKLARIARITSISVLSLLALTGQAIASTPRGLTMRDARETANKQMLFIAEFSDKSGNRLGLNISYNNLLPHGFCYAFFLMGDWKSVEDEYGVLFLADARKSSFGYSIIDKAELRPEDGNNVFEKAIHLLERGNIALRNRFAPSVKISSSNQITNIAGHKVLIWRAELDGNQFDGPYRLTIPAHFLIPIPNGSLLNLKINSSLGDEREVSIATDVISSFVATRDPECFFPILEEWIRD